MSALSLCGVGVWAETRDHSVRQPSNEQDVTIRADQLSGSDGSSPEVFRRLQDLLAYPQEDLNTELKSWLDLTSEDDRANLAQALLALSNFGGGYVILGFSENGGVWQPAIPRPTNYNLLYTQDSVNGVVDRYADPPFQCQVHHVPHPQSSETHPVIEVPGKHKVPIRARRDGPNGRHVHQNSYYIRRPGPKSEPPQSSQEWTDLIDRCIRAAREEMLSSIRDLLVESVGVPRANPTDVARSRLDQWVSSSRGRFQELLGQNVSIASRYSHGTWMAAYALEGQPAVATLSNLLALLIEARGHETGWPPWWVPTRQSLAPYPHDGTVECWMRDVQSADAGHSDFWRASPEGLLFLLRGYQEDSSRLQPGGAFDLTLPIWRVGECLLHAERLSRALGAVDASVVFRFTWDGLRGRTLVAWANPGRTLFETRRASQDSVTTELSVPTGRISPNLPELVGSITRPLYEVFDFFTIPQQTIQQEVSQLRGSFLP